VFFPIGTHFAKVKRIVNNY